MKKLLICIFLLIAIFDSSNSRANEKLPYFIIEPDIITIIPNSTDELKYIRITAQLSFREEKYKSIIKYHEPSLKGAIIDVLRKQPLDRIRSLTGREEIRLDCLNELQRILIIESSQAIISDLLFTKYLYN